MERSSKGSSDYQRHRQTLKRMKQGLPALIEKFKRMQTPVEDGVEVPAIFKSRIPSEIFEELKKRAEIAMSRFVNGDVPTYALRASPAEPAVGGGNLTATGRVKRRYETKAIRMAKEAAKSVGNIVDTITAPATTTPVVPTAQFQMPPFFYQMAQQFTKK